MSTTTAPLTATRSVRDVVVALRSVADLFWSLHTDDDLAAAVDVDVTLRAGYVPGNDDAAKQAMVDQVAAIFGVPAAFTDTSAGYGMYRAKVHGEGQPWALTASAYVARPDPNAALHAELEQLRAKVAAFEHTFRPMTEDDDRETYAQTELDQDRNPTAEGFAAWQARRAEAYQAHQDGQR